MAGKQVALVTGSNKGIGFATVRILCKEFPGDVILTARDEKLGKAAVDALKKEGCSPLFHILDIKSKPSVEALKQFLTKTYGGLDILINNAGIAFQNNDPVPFRDQVKQNVATNFEGTLNVCEELLPLLRPHARVVNMSTRVANIAYSRCSDIVKKRIVECSTVEQVKQLMADFVQAAESDKCEQLGFPDSPYGMSKVGVVLLTAIYQSDVDKEGRDDIVFNCCCPGMVNTELSGNRGKTVEQGADMPVYLSLLPPNIKTPRGQFLAEKKVIDLTSLDSTRI